MHRSLSALLLTAAMAYVPPATAAAMAYVPPATAAAQSTNHVLLISVDGRHALDVELYVQANPKSALAELSRHGITYSHARTPSLSDSFPGLLALKIQQPDQRQPHARCNRTAGIWRGLHNLDQEKRRTWRHEFRRYQRGSDCLKSFHQAENPEDSSGNLASRADAFAVFGNRSPEADVGSH